MKRKYAACQRVSACGCTHSMRIDVISSVVRDARHSINYADNLMDILILIRIEYFYFDESIVCCLDGERRIRTIVTFVSMY